MALKLFKGIPLIDDSTSNDDLFLAKNPDTNEVYSRGAVPRDYNLYPATMFAPPSTIPLLPEANWRAAYDEMNGTKSSLENIYLSQPDGGPAFINLDQNGQGYCWNYSTAHCVMIARLRDNQPNPRLNPHASACIIKNGRDEGGWCGLSAQWGVENGFAEEGTGEGQWPLHSMDLRRYHTTALRQAMLKNRITQDWIDLTRPVWGRNLTFQQLMTCLFMRMPCAVDFNWWGHSVCAIAPVLVEAGSWGILILNSWLRWGRFGLAIIQGQRAVPDGAVCIREVTGK